ncbi:hypothetical protein Sf18_gp75 [Shigella phage Sf18]|uniref:Uncharacterized protein n=3 Tax=Mooglevirus Sf17 TaxID=2560758 RepID=A0A291AY67_9CAUD|nr:hypothetical protein FDJ00_gp037 [Shigella phage Sf17]ATE85938.1 hypothetical protein Sf15_gp5 [Shigella phage Sf15]ATE86349.1 hypothetical protein Sf18_gp75 [Shigella phage Sf18]AUV62997.1 hypothetical protein Sf17_gp125 [Shigella phage Sf17]ELT8207024.1 hypothetical protein [Escherichia coli]
MNFVEATFEVQKEKFTIIYEAVNICEASHCVENWKFTDEHKGGVTIKLKNPERNGYKYAIPQHYSLSQLMSDYAKQGRENPSIEAYKSLQDELQRDLEANSYVLFAKVEDKEGNTVLNSFSLAYGFDWCYLDGEDLDSRLEEEVSNSDGESEVMERLEALKDSVMNIFNI